MTDQTSDNVARFYPTGKPAGPKPSMYDHKVQVDEMCKAHGLGTVLQELRNWTNGEHIALHAQSSQNNHAERVALRELTRALEVVTTMAFDRRL